ncbi:MAG: aminotransferase, partial [Bacteroidota bacterium]
MLHCQREKFDLDREVAYLNCANIAPLMQELVQMGQAALDKRARPYLIKREDWFAPVEQVKSLFNTLINA